MTGNNNQPSNSDGHDEGNEPETDERTVSDYLRLAVVSGDFIEHVSGLADWILGWSL